MMTPSVWPITTHNPTWQARIPQWSLPHRKVMDMLAHYRSRFGLRSLEFITEQPIVCNPCGNPVCWHRYKADIVLVNQSTIIEIHRPQNDELKQEMRKHCLENSGWRVVTIDDKTAQKFPELVLMKIMKMEELSRAGIILGEYEK